MIEIKKPQIRRLEKNISALTGTRKATLKINDKSAPGSLYKGLFSFRGDSKHSLKLSCAIEFIPSPIKVTMSGTNSFVCLWCLASFTRAFYNISVILGTSDWETM